MTTSTPKPPAVRSLERMLAILAAAACAFITIAIWRQVSTSQGMWPLPALYFIELPAAGILVALLFLLGHPAVPLVTFAAAGLYLGFAIMGAFSIGILYVPIAVMFLLLAVLAAVRQEAPILKCLGVFLIAALGQAAIMLILVRLLLTSH